MKKTIISVFSITSLVAVNLIALKFRLKPPKKEVFNFDEPLKEEEQELLDEYNQYDFSDKRIQSSEKKDENITIIGNTEGGQKEFVEPNILLKSSSEQPYVYQDFCHSLGDVILSNQMKIEDVPQELRLLGGSQLYQKAWLHNREHFDVERYILTFRLLLNDIKSFKGNGVWTRKEAIKLILDELINGLDFFNENKFLIDFIIDQKDTLEGFGILYGPDYSSAFSKEKIRTDENEEADFFSLKAKMLHSNKSEIKVLGYIIRRVIHAHEQGADFIVFKNFKYFKKQRYSYLYLVEHADEIEQSKNILRVVVTDIYVAIYFERK